MNAWGLHINFGYDSKGRIRTLTDPAGRTSSYEYDGPTGGCLASAPNSAACSANNLTKRNQADDMSRQYAHNELANIDGRTACASTFIAVGNGFGHLPYEPEMSPYCRW